MQLATHSGPFHADDVFACALLRTYFAPDLTVIRTRDLDLIAKADLVIDVGGLYDPAAGRFDHHQRDYQGELSSAGMVLRWLTEEEHIPAGLAAKLKTQWVDYIDAVDNGMRQPADDVPCFSSMVSVLAEQSDDDAGHDRCYLEAVEIACSVLRGLNEQERREQEGREVVAAAMKVAEESGSRIMRLERFHSWKRAYFELGGEDHPTEFLLLPQDGAWRIFAIPPVFGSFANKRPLPAEWGGLVDEELSQVIGVPNARFCHKKLFIAVFGDKESAELAIEKWGLDTAP